MVYIQTDGGFALAQNQWKETNPVFYICTNKQCKDVPFVVTHVKDILEHVKKHKRKKRKKK